MLLIRPKIEEIIECSEKRLKIDFTIQCIVEGINTGLRITIKRNFIKLRIGFVKKRMN
jgi:hypothetical protein